MFYVYQYELDKKDRDRQAKGLPSFLLVNHPCVPIICTALFDLSKNSVVCYKGLPRMPFRTSNRACYTKYKGTSKSL
jgi:hypothetical protein